MSKAIIITGTPGTGKTTLAKEISEATGMKIIDLKAFAKKHHLIEYADKKRNTLVIDEHKLTKKIEHFLSESNGLYVVEGHMSHFIRPKYVSLCIVTNTPLKILQERLTRRGYSREKIRENLDAEIFDICCQEASERNLQPFRCHTHINSHLRSVLYLIHFRLKSL